MAGGCIDIYGSRRNKPLVCYYWKVKDTKEYEKLIHENKPSGVFYASEVRPENYQRNILNGMFNFVSSSFYIETYDNIETIRPNDLVKVDGVYYLVISMQNLSIHKNQYFGKKSTNKYVLELRGYK